jgi:Protein of unknown function (DUF3277)
MSSNFGFDIYDLDQVVAIFFGATISTGPGTTPADEGGFLKITQDGDDFKVKKGALGRLIRSKTNEPYTIVEVHLLQTAQQNAVFSTVWARDKGNPNGAGVGTCSIKDLQGTSKFTAERIWVVKPPDREWNQEQKGLVWTIGCALVDRVDGGN